MKWEPLAWKVRDDYTGIGVRQINKEQEREDEAFDKEIDRLRALGRFDLVKKKIGTVGDPPPHYAGGIEPIKFIQSHGMDYATGAAVKYLVRFRHKGTPLEDLMKAKAYIDLLLEELED